MLQEPKRILFVINKGSGNKNTDWRTLIEEHFSRLSHKTEYFMMPVEDASDKLKVKLRNFLPELVVAVGGDGTVSLVARETLGSGIPMAIIPAGSANGMARELNIPVEPEKVFDVILNGEVRSTDVIRINDSEICLHLSDLGLNAQLVKYFQEGNTRGKVGYALALVKALNRRRRMNVWIKTKDEEVVRSASMVLIANASKYGTGATINPEGSIYDGTFEVVVVRRLNMLHVLKMFLRFQRFNPERIESFQARSVRIETSRRMHFQVDGEYLGKVTRVEAQCMPGALRLVVPRAA